MADSTAEAGFRPGSMAGPVNVLVCDFDRAICLAWLSGVQVFLVQQARELCWSKPLARSRSPLGRNALPDPEPFAFDTVALGTTLGCDPSVIRRNIRALKKMNILVHSDRLNMVINKDYRSWTREDGSPLLSIVQVEFAKSGASLGGYRLPTDPSDTQTPRTFLSAGDVDPSEARTKRSANGQKGPPEDEKVRALPNGAGAGSDARSGNFSSPGSKTEEKTPLTPQGGATTTRLASTPEQAKKAGLAVGQLVYSAGKDEALAEVLDSHARMLCDQYPAADVVASYTAQCRERVPPHKWANAVATNLANRARATAQAEDAAAPKPKRPAPAPSPRTPEQDDFLRRMKEAGL